MPVSGPEKPMEIVFVSSLLIFSIISLKKKHREYNLSSSWVKLG